MNNKFLPLCLVLSLSSSGLFAKFSGIPDREYQPPPRQERQISYPPPSSYRTRPEPLINHGLNPDLILALLNISNIDEPLGYREERSLNDIADLLQNISQASDRDGISLFTGIYRSNLRQVTKINLLVAIFSGLLNNNRRELGPEDLQILLQWKDQANLLTEGTYDDLQKALREAMNSASRRSYRILKDISDEYRDDREESLRGYSFDRRRGSGSSVFRR